ncbi:MAG: hypothetical protein V3V14_02925 [Saprospiraceae bacterium]
MGSKINQKTYSSKILLFGEYTILHGSKAVAIPYNNYFGSWKYKASYNDRDSLHPIKQYLFSLYQTNQMNNFDFDKLEYQLTKGLYFDSNIPQGYGIGSSGALTAAIFDRFVVHKQQCKFTDLKAMLALIESFFHGSSSGLDPLISYLNQPILIHNDKKIEFLDFENKIINNQLFLLDTGIDRSTSPLVKAYLETRKSSEIFIMKMQLISEINDLIIDNYLSQDIENLEKYIQQLSQLQYETLKMLIPPHFYDLWENGITTKSYSLKLNGAGGGGFLMLFLHNTSISIANICKKYNIAKYQKITT